MAQPPDHYATLKIAPDADIEVVRAAYRALMLKHHPDKNQNPAALSQAMQINAAYAILGDPDKRAAYDREQATAHVPVAAPAPEVRRRPDPRPTPVRDVLVAVIFWRAVGMLGALAAMAVGAMYLQHALSSANAPLAGITQAFGSVGGPGATTAPRVIHVQPGQFGRGSRSASLLTTLRSALSAPHYSREMVHGVAIYRRDDPWSWLRVRLAKITQWGRPRSTPYRPDPAGSGR